MRVRCPYCKAPFITREFVGTTGEIELDIRDHACSAFVTLPALSTEPTDTSFIRAARNSPEGLAAWREYVERQR